MNPSPLAALVLALAACTADPPVDETGSPTTSIPADPLPAALGGCTATGAEVDADLGPLSTRIHQYDDTGDPVLATADYLDDATFYDWTIASTFGLPHQTATSVVTYTRATGWTSTYTWDGDHLVRVETDAASDGTVDEVESWTFDGDHEAHTEWDGDADGVADDTMDLTWAEEDGGWRVTGAGTDADGTYTTDEWRDAELRTMTYRYAHQSGLSVAWEVAAFSSIGATGSYTSETRQDGALIEETAKTRTFDAEGRESSEVYTKTGYANDVETGTFTRTIDTTYDCPG
ncbi:MAG: hypothetical protein ABMB14_21420 [Myxococcota bacterium]